MSASHALQAVKSLRLRAIKNLPVHISRFGPLPPSTTVTASLRLPNPFTPQQNPKTGKWHPPKISLRRQADLVKLAKASNSTHLLPPGLKTPRLTDIEVQAATEAHSESHQGGKALRGYSAESEKIWSTPVEWIGKVEHKEVAGADIGTRLYAAKKRMFKGHKWERVKAARDSKKEILVRDMARRIRNYKAYYRKRRPNPLKSSTSSKARKLPF